MDQMSKMETLSNMALLLVLELKLQFCIELNRNFKNDNHSLLMTENYCH